MINDPGTSDNASVSTVRTSSELLRTSTRTTELVGAGPGLTASHATGEPRHLQARDHQVGQEAAPERQQGAHVQPAAGASLGQGNTVMTSAQQTPPTDGADPSASSLLPGDQAPRPRRPRAAPGPRRRWRSDA